VQAKGRGGPLGGMHRTQLTEKIKSEKRREIFCFCLSLSLWEEMWVQLKTSLKAKQYQR